MKFSLIGKRNRIIYISRNVSHKKIYVHLMNIQLLKVAAAEVKTFVMVDVHNQRPVDLRFCQEDADRMVIMWDKMSKAVIWQIYHNIQNKHYSSNN